MALLTRGRSAPSPVLGSDAGMTVVEHLEDLRRALVISLLAWGLATLAALAASARIIDFLVARAGLSRQGLFVTAPSGGLIFALQVAAVVGLVAAAPVIIWQLWWFVSPGLHG